MYSEAESGARIASPGLNESHLAQASSVLSAATTQLRFFSCIPPKAHLEFVVPMTQHIQANVSAVGLHLELSVWV